MSVVTELGYFGIGVRDIGAWKAFAGEVLGFEVVEGEDALSCAFRMDYWSQRIVVTENGADDIGFVGWRVADAAAFDALRGRLRSAGVPHAVASAGQACDRQVLGLMTLSDPGAVPIEIFYGPRIEPGLPFRPGRRMHGPFVTGERGLGHVVMDVADPDACEAFYRDLAGMRGSVEFEIPLPPDQPAKALRMHFMSCNARQHSLAFSRFGGDKRLSHVMTEFAKLEDVGLTRDIAKRRNIPIQMDIGQHHNDRAVSLYLVTPSGWSWECGWGVAAPSGQAEWGSAPIWGHDHLAPRSSTARRSV
jgi:2,3-dihydroxybiphenyl 1,2-dioxygenase